MKLGRTVAAASLALLVACSGGTTPGGSRQPAAPAKKAPPVVPAGVIKAAFAKAVAAKSARVAMTMDFTSPDGSGTVTGRGVMSLADARGALSFDFSGLPESPLSGTLDMRFLGTVMYMKIPALASGGKPWVKIDFKALSKLSGVDLGELTQLQSQDPASTLRYLAAVSGDVRKVGTEKVRGVSTTHYAANVDLAKALAQLPAGARGGLQKLLDEAKIESLPVDVWIGGDGLLRKMTMTMDLSGVGKAGSGTVTIAMELYDYGVPVSVTAPPASQVTDFSALFGRSSG